MQIVLISLGSTICLVLFLYWFFCMLNPINESKWNASNWNWVKWISEKANDRIMKSIYYENKKIDN